MERRKDLYGIGAAAGMLVLILDGKTALAGARSGIELCLMTVIPALFPFIVLSILLSGALLGASIPPLRPVGKILKMPEGTESLLLCAFLGGYPSGAVAVSEAFRAGSLSKGTAERLISFCNNAGPAFLFGMTLSLFPDAGAAWLLWGIHILSALAVGILIPGKESSPVKLKKGGSSIGVIKKAITVMATVCAWVILFRIIITFLDRWILWLFPPEVRVAVIGVLELSNGCCSLALVSDVRVRLILCSGMLALGGLCVTMQTVSSVRGLKMNQYYLGKILQFVCSILLSAAAVFHFWWVFPIFVVAVYLFSGRSKKISGNSVPTGV